MAGEQVEDDLIRWEAALGRHLPARAATGPCQFTQDFDFIQLDPHGGIGFPVGFLKGRPVYAPSKE